MKPTWWNWQTRQVGNFFCLKMLKNKTKMMLRLHYNYNFTSVTKILDGNL